MLQGPGCRFENGDGSVTTFQEGQSMGAFSTVDSCANNVPSAFPGYCISSARNQTVYPYCFFRDSFSQNICARSGEEIGLLHPNRTLIHCNCKIFVTPNGHTYDVKVASNCDMVDFANTAPASLADMVETQQATVRPSTPAPTTSSPTTTPPTSQPTTAKPTTGAPLTISPTTPNPTTMTPTTANPTTPNPTTAT